MNAVEKCNVTEKSVNKGSNKKKSKNKKNQQQQQQNQVVDGQENDHPIKDSMVMNNGDKKSTPSADVLGKNKLTNEDNGTVAIVNGDTLNAISEKLNSCHIKENGCIENFPSVTKNQKKSTSNNLEIRNGRANSPTSSSSSTLVQQQKSKSQTKKNNTISSVNNKSSSSPTLSSSSSSSSSSQQHPSSPKQSEKVFESQQQQQVHKKIEKNDSNLDNNEIVSSNGTNNNNNNSRLTKKHKKSKSKSLPSSSTPSTSIGVSKNDSNFSNENSTPTSNEVSIASTTPIPIETTTEITKTVVEESSCRNCMNDVEINETSQKENNLSTSDVDVCIKGSDDSSHINNNEMKNSITNCSGDNENSFDTCNNGSSSSSCCLGKKDDTTPAAATGIEEGEGGGLEGNVNEGKLNTSNEIQTPSSTLITTAQSLSNGDSSSMRFDRSTIVIDYKEYESELQMQDIMRLIQTELSEPYSIYTYRYFIYNWPKLCFLAAHGNEYVGAIVCKLDMHMNVKRGYIAMLAVKREYRKLRIGTNLVQKAIEAMLADNADEVVLETEMKNIPALRLYENLGFVRDKRLFRYYLNGVDALRLKLWFR